MPFIRPSLVLQAMLVPEEYSEDTAKEIKRSYMYIAQSIVKELPADQAKEGNIMQFRIRLMKPYWNEADPAAAELWDAVMPHWLRNQVVNMSTAMHNYNTVTHPGQAKNVQYAWADFEFNDNATIRVKMTDDNTLGADIPALAAQVRHLMAAGAFGEDKPALIRVPSLASYTAQREAWEAQVAEAKRINDEADRAEAEAAEEAKAQEQAAEAGAAAGAEADAKGAAAQADGTEAAAGSAAGAVVEERPQSEEAAPEGAAAAEAADDAANATQPREIRRVEVPAFELDYRVWGLEYPDGRVAEFQAE